MSQIDKLIADLCPDGVSHYQLGEIAGYSDTRAQASHLDKTTFVGVDNLLSNKGGRVDASHAPNTSSLTAYETGDLLFGNIRPYLKKIWLSDRTGGCSGDVLAIRLSKAFHPIVDARFLYYTLSSDKFFSYATQHSKGAKMPRGDKAAILKFRVPVPPLEVQREIARVLDKFTQLEAELEAELEARRKQYEYYRNSLLSFDQPGGGGKIMHKPLGDVTVYEQPGKYIVKSTIYKDSYNTPVLTPGKTFVLGYTDESDSIYPASQRSVILFDDFTSAFKWVDFDFKVKSSAVKMITAVDESQVTLRYIYYWMQTTPPTLVEGDHKRQWISSFSKKQIPIPSLAEQRRIVRILDKFDALTNSLTEGLPKEVELRRKQYEYYREQLLTF